MKLLHPLAFMIFCCCSLSCVKEMEELEMSEFEANIDQYLVITDHEYSPLFDDIRCNFEVNYDISLRPNIKGIGVLKNGALLYRITNPDQKYFVEYDLPYYLNSVCYQLVFYTKQGAVSKASVKYCIDLE